MESEGASADPPSGADPIEAAWTELEGHWDDPAAHKKFLTLADSLDRLALAGQRYRAVKEQATKDGDAARAATAAKQIDVLLGLAMGRVKAVEKTDLPPKRSRIEWIAFGVSTALIAAALWSMLRSF
jgi:hypothetical protein